jgi:uncharacterized membrane protein YfcA
MNVDWLLVVAAAIFFGAGAVKGLIGMGLPTIAMGLLVLVMPPVQAAALLVVPSFVTNLWQLLSGPKLGGLLGRLWTMMAGIVLGTIAGAGMLAGDAAGMATIGLGGALVLYALLGLMGVRFETPARREFWLSPLIGVTTGLVTGATGVFVLPAVPYLQSLGFEKDELIQALGLSFTISTLALAAGLFRVDAFAMVHAGGMSVLAIAPAIAGMFAGQLLRDRVSVITFRTIFLVGLFALGAYLALRGLVQATGS